MSFVLMGAMLAAWLVGGLFVAALWPRDRSWQADLPLILPLGVILGTGLTSVVFFAASLFSNQPAIAAGAVEIVTAMGLMWIVWRRAAPTSASLAPAIPRWSWVHWLVASLFLQATVVAAIVAWRAFDAEPYGGWDGWAIWNMHARFMLRAGTAWPELLGSPQLSWTHADYPRLVPASVARLWAWTGAESPVAGAGLSVSFAAASVALLVGAVARTREPMFAFLSGLLLLSTPFFVSFASNQHADIPLGSFMFAAVVLVVVGGNAPPSRGTLILAGISTGLAAWTKNEGLLFAVAFGAFVCLHEGRHGRRQGVLVFLVALAASLVPALYFKLFLAPANDLVSAPFGPRAAYGTELARHQMILSSWWRDVRGFGEWQVTPYLAMALPLVLWHWRRRLTGCEHLIPLLIGVMLVGYYFVYLVSPHDLTWHLNTSLVRLLVPLWPLAIFWWSLALPDVPPSQTVAPGKFSRRLLFAGANVLGAGAIAAALSTQLAANELAVRRDGSSEISARLGEGWYGRERHQRDLWAWSAGRGLLHLQATPGHDRRPITLHFALRSLAPRTVIIRDGERELWRGAMRDEFVRVEITGLRLPPGDTTIEFTTDAAGIPESPGPGARSLAFAIYDLELR